MKNNEKYIMILYLIILVLVGINIISNRNIIFDNNKIILKNMDESTQLSDKEKTINDLNKTKKEYENYITTSKTNLAEAITFAGVNTEETDSFETMVSNINSIARHAEFKSLQLTANVEQTVNIGYEPKRIMFFGWEEDDEGCLFGVYDSYLNTKDIIRVSKNINAAWGGNGTYTSGNLTINDNGFTILLNSNAIGYTSNGTIYYVCE